MKNVTNNTWTQSYGHEQEDSQEPQETQEKCQTKPKGAILINNVILGLKSIATFKVINIYEKKPLVFMRLTSAIVIHGHANHYVITVVLFPWKEGISSLNEWIPIKAKQRPCPR